MFMKRIDNYFITVKGELIDDCHSVNIVKLNKDNSYEEKDLYYKGTMDTFNNMSEIHLVNLMDKLITLENHSKFSLKREITYAVK